MFLIKVSCFYFCGSIEGDAIFSSNIKLAESFSTLEDLEKVVKKYNITGYAVGGGGK